MVFRIHTFMLKLEILKQIDFLLICNFPFTLCHLAKQRRHLNKITFSDCRNLPTNVELITEKNWVLRVSGVWRSDYSFQDFWEQ